MRKFSNEKGIAWEHVLVIMAYGDRHVDLSSCATRTAASHASPATETQSISIVSEFPNLGENLTNKGVYGNL